MQDATDMSPRPPERSPARWGEALDHHRRSRAKVAYTVRRVPLDDMATLVRGRVRPRSGDLVLARVDRIGQHPRLELTNGRKSRLHLGDEIVVAYADRYAPDQFEAHVPVDLSPTHLVAGGGVAGDMISRSAAVRRPTQLTPIGLVGDAGHQPLNIGAYGLDPGTPLPAYARRPTLAVVGTSMNSGKTTTVRYLVHGLNLAGRRPGTAKVTGTGAGGDYWIMHDAGAHRVLDFVDAGLASTYRMPIGVVEQTFDHLVGHLVRAGCSNLLLEVADGVYQDETAALLDSPVFHRSVGGVVFAAGEALGAVAGVQRLRELGLPVLAVSGKLTASPLAVRETEAALDLPVLGVDELSDPAVATDLADRAVVLPTLAAAPATDDDAVEIDVDVRVEAEPEPAAVRRIS